MNPSKLILYSLLALALVRGLIYGAVVPPWQAPDEPAQFERVKASLSAADWNSNSQNGPAWYDELSKSLFTFRYWDFVDASRPSYVPNSIGRYIALYQEIYQGLYGSRGAYVVMAWPLFLAPHQDITPQLYLVRVNMVLMNVAVIFLAYLIVRTIFPGDTFLVLGTPLIILFNPQHTHLMSTVNNGNLAELLATTVLYFMVAGIMQGFSLLKIFAMLSLSLVAMWTKATAYFLPLAIGSLMLFYLPAYRRHWRWLLLSGAILAALVYFFIPQRLILLLASFGALASSGNFFYLDPLVPIDLFRSFWAYPGWMILQLHPFWYQLLFLSCLLALIGLLGLLAKGRLGYAPSRRLQFRVLLVLAIAVASSIVTILAWNAVTQSIVYRQGRSIYPVIVPISLFLMLGWRQLIPAGWRRFSLLALTVGLSLFDSLVLFGYIIPFFYSNY
ncbi:MAG: hypothetical protein BroJett011_45730 [Chloroflexota bacterium]|nr:MAG: hypothetical protein BroJett011_45730 [Chloroflexota bacterium]